MRIQTSRGEEMKTAAMDQSLRSTSLPAMRGSIYDATGTKVLAQSASVWTVVLEPYFIAGDEELRRTICSVREMFPGKSVTAVFQPHLYTRTRDFADDFARSLSAVDRLIMLPIYPAREEPIEGVDSRMILDAVTAPEKSLVGKEELLDVLRADDGDVLITFGAGDIDRFVELIREMLEKR